MQKVKFSKREKSEAIQGYLFILPWLLGFICLTGGPLVFSFFASFSNYDMTSQMDFIGLGNFKKMFFQDRLFWKSLYNTFWYVLVGVPFSTIGAILISLLLNRRVKGSGIFQLFFYLPTVLSGVAVYALWMQMLAPESGLMNRALALIGIQGPAWLFDPNWTKPALVVMRFWGLGTSMLLYLSALNSVPKELYESADIDGARSISKFFKITLPMISPIVFFNIITNIIGAFQIFQEAYVISENGEGGPAASLMFYNLHLFRQGFINYRMGYASAMAWFLFIIIMAITAINMVVSKYWVYYGSEKV